MSFNTTNFFQGLPTVQTVNPVPYVDADIQKMHGFLQMAQIMHQQATGGQLPTQVQQSSGLGQQEAQQPGTAPNPYVVPAQQIAYLQGIANLKKTLGGEPVTPFQQQELRHQQQEIAMKQAQFGLSYQMDQQKLQQEQFAHQQNQTMNAELQQAIQSKNPQVIQDIGLKYNKPELAKQAIASIKMNDPMSWLTPAEQKNVDAQQAEADKAQMSLEGIDHDIAVVAATPTGGGWNKADRTLSDIWAHAPFTNPTAYQQQILAFGKVNAGQALDFLHTRINRLSQGEIPLGKSSVLSLDNIPEENLSLMYQQKADKLALITEQQMREAYLNQYHTTTGFTGVANKYWKAFPLLKPDPKTGFVPGIEPINEDAWQGIIAGKKLKDIIPEGGMTPQQIELMKQGY